MNTVQRLHEDFQLSNQTEEFRSWQMGALPCEEQDPSPSAQRDSAASPLLKTGIDFFGVIYRSEHSLLEYALGIHVPVGYVQGVIAQAGTNVHTALERLLEAISLLIIRAQSRPRRKVRSSGEHFSPFSHSQHSLNKNANL